MDIYKQAAKEDLRFQTVQGSLTVSQLFHLSIPVLDLLAIKLEEDFNASGKKSFIVKRTKKDATAKLRFDIVLDVLTTKVDEASDAAETANIKAHNNKIDAAIIRAEENELEGKSVKELMKLRK